jgi:two-component system, OmpR family, KDP operon response regulator KdpE
VDNASILVVDDEPQIRRVLRATLFNAGYDVIEAKNGQEAIETVLREHPDLILLDVNMPEMSGVESCSRIRLSFEGPIIMLSVLKSEQDKIAAFNSGADDYIVKPFTMGELLVRIRTALRHFDAGQSLPKIETPELNVDLDRRIVDVRGNRAHMTPKEFEVLRTLVIQQGKAVTYKKILQAVWGPDYGEETEKVRTVIAQIRKKIEKDPAHPRYILTEPWFGYRFQIPSETTETRRRKS